MKIKYITVAAFIAALTAASNIPANANATMKNDDIIMSNETLWQGLMYKIEDVAFNNQTILPYNRYTIQPTHKFEDDLGFDSLMFTELIVSCTDSYNIEFSDEEISSIETVGDLYELIDDKIDTI